MPADLAAPLADGVSVFERGWLSSNNVLLDAGEEGVVLIDSSHTVHAPQTLALLQRALDGRPLRRLINTHLHSDHCGGNAAVQRTFGARVATPAGSHAAAAHWDEDALSYRATGQLCERFKPDESIVPGDVLAIGRRRWLVLAAPGHDPHSVILFDEREGLLISADALWENGFGVIFPELEGEDAFGAQEAVLRLIEELAPRVAIPGHGSPFGDLPQALARARSRLQAFVADPARHARHAIRVLVKYHLMEVRQQGWPAYVDWFAATPLVAAVWQRLGQPDRSLKAFARRIAEDLVQSGALRADSHILQDRA